MKLYEVGDPVCIIRTPYKQCPVGTHGRVTQVVFPDEHYPDGRVLYHVDTPRKEWAFYADELEKVDEGQLARAHQSGGTESS